ncbi:hypothetical protein, partial [Streptomyces roseolus]|uniref:hypothetical protein n=1 Tax=Streptomyces roseolus TaxID=67358 RepID=UPI0036537A23
LRPSGRFLRFPSFPTLSDLSDPISSVLSGPEIEFPGAFRRGQTLPGFLHPPDHPSAFTG